MYSQSVWNVISLVLLLITMNCGISTAQYPRVPCPDIFEYSQSGNRNVGIITLRGVTYGQTRVEIELSQPGNYNLGYSGQLSLNFDKDRIFDFVSSGSPITYKVDFPIQNVIPHVTFIKVNGNLICSGQQVRPPSTTITLEHTLTAPQPSSSFTTQRRPFPMATPNSNFINFNAPQSVRNPFEEQNQRYDAESARKRFEEQNKRMFEDFLRLSNNQGGIEPTFNFPNPSPPDYNVRNEGSIRNPPAAVPAGTTISSPITSSLGQGQASMFYINSVCGIENVNFSVRRLAVKGQIVPKARFPWIAAIFKKNRASLSFQCGGSLISTRTVISAAHCFYTDFNVIPEQDILVSLGRHNLTDWSDAYILHSDVEKIIQHPDYRPELPNIDADLALVRLRQSVTFSNAIRPVCMWQGSSDVENIVGVSGTVVGWGRDMDNDVTTTPRLVTANIVSEITCIRSNDKLLYLTSNRTLCAGNRDGSGPCQGDSGSGLMIKTGNKWKLRGTVSAALGTAINQCNLDEYVVYTDIAKFSDWIQSNMLL